MIRQLYRYFFPKYRLPHIPARHLSADYANNLNAIQARIMEAGLARDPSKAQTVWDALYKQHGDQAYPLLEHYLARKRNKRLGEKFWRLMRRVFGENEYTNLKPRKVDKRVLPTYKFEE